MLALRPSSTTQKTTPNLLPTKIHHNGPIPLQPRHWSPTTTSSSSSSSSEDKTKTAYFRGRKLRGRNVRVPEGYEGWVLLKTDETISTAGQKNEGVALAEQLRRMEEGDEDEEVGEEMGEEAEVKIMQTQARFEEVVIWGHEAVPEDEDVYVKGVEEWVGFAEAMHSYDAPNK